MIYPEEKLTNITVHVFSTHWQARGSHSIFTHPEFICSSCRFKPTLVLLLMMPRQPHSPPRPLEPTIHAPETLWRTTKTKIAGIHLVPRA
jgi:hypothetical protein